MTCWWNAQKQMSDFTQLRPNISIAIPAERHHQRSLLYSDTSPTLRLEQCYSLLKPLSQCSDRIAVHCHALSANCCQLSNCAVTALQNCECEAAEVVGQHAGNARNNSLLLSTLFPATAIYLQEISFLAVSLRIFSLPRKFPPFIAVKPRGGKLHAQTSATILQMKYYAATVNNMAQHYLQPL
jgi:hypothetical protein